MSSLLYHALWLSTALGGIALATALIAHRKRVRADRRCLAEDALDALAAYSEWLGEQRRCEGFDGDRPPELSPLAQVRRLQERGFPQLSAGMVRLLEAHSRMLDFLWRQQLMRARDPEAWLESDHDEQFMALWREHRAAVHALADQLREGAGELMVDAQPESVYPSWTEKQQSPG